MTWPWLLVIRLLITRIYGVCTAHVDPVNTPFNNHVRSAHNHITSTLYKDSYVHASDQTIIQLYIQFLHYNATDDPLNFFNSNRKSNNFLLDRYYNIMG